MRCARQALLGASALFLLGTWVVGSTQAGEFYINGLIGISGGSGSITGNNTLANFDLGGESSDSSPALGAAVGFQFLLGDVMNRDIRLPNAIPWNPRIPNFNIRFEIEGIAGRDYELKTPGFNSSTPYYTDVNSWSIMFNWVWELPLYPMTRALFGRVRGLDQMSVYYGTGIGFARNEVETTDSLVRGSTSTHQFSYQWGAGVAYNVTDRFQISAGYRRVDMGTVDLVLTDGADVDRGFFSIDLHSNEAILTLKTTFYSLSWPRRRSRSMEW